MKFLAFWLVALLAVVAGAEPLTLDQAVERALRVNLDYQTTLLAVDRAQNSLVGWLNWKNVAVSATQKQSSATGPGSQPTSTSLGVALPLFDQLGASASIDQAHNAQVSVTANPLAHSDNATQAQIALDRARLTATQARATLETAVRQAYLAQSLAEATVALQAAKVALSETSYRDAKARYEKATVTLAEVRTALQNWTQARSTLTAAERTRVKARADLAARLQGEIEVLAPQSLDLEALMKNLGPLDTSLAGDPVAVRVQALEVQSQQAKADALWLVDPGLSLQGSASFPASGEPNWSGSVTLTLALGDWQGSEKSLAERSLGLAQQALNTQRTEAQSSQAQALLAVQSAQDAVEMRVLARDQAQELLTETQLLAKAGDATELEVEDASLGVTAAELDLFGARADLYGAHLEWTLTR